ncbi:MAG: M10 family metallopeptidase C-terminal domain-containing protein [Betaproteobacteria bacterium]|nr:M10 family metallopeptidase C-terminal domain-containing protein [Betaproteobacteria bacterium]
MFKTITRDSSRVNLSDTDGGTDWLDMSAMTDDLIVKMQQGNNSTVGGITFLRIALGTEIENLVTGDGDDTLTGSRGSNAIYGMRGDDDIFSADGDDLLSGGAGNDTLRAGRVTTSSCSIALLTHRRTWTPSSTSISFTTMTCPPTTSGSVTWYSRRSRSAPSPRRDSWSAPPPRTRSTVSSTTMPRGRCTTTPTVSAARRRSSSRSSISSRP